MDMKIKWKKSDDAVSEVIGAILMVGIGVALFSILYFIVMSYPFTPSSPVVDIVGTIEGNNIILEHRGGDSLDLDVTVSFIVGGTRISATVDDYLIDSNGNNRWDIGERLVYPSGDMTNLQVEATVVDMDSNSIVMMGVLQEGETTAIPSLATSVGTISPYNQASSPLAVSATGDSDLDTVTLYYRWSDDNSTWDGTYIADENNNTVDINGCDEDASPDKGTETNFANVQDTAPDLDVMNIKEENTGGSPSPPAVEVFSTASTSNNRASVNVDKPLGTVEGDLLVSTFTHDSASGTLSSPTGWTDFFSTLSTGGSTFLCSYKIAAASEPSTYTFASTDSDQLAVGIVRISGVDTYNPINAQSSTNTGSSNSPNCLSTTTTKNNTLVLRLMSADDDDYGFGSNYPSGHTGIYTVQSTGSNGETHTAVAYKVQTSASSTDSANFFMTAGEQWGTITVAINPENSINYEIDFEYQWTTADYEKENKEVCIYVDSHTGSENLNINYYNGGSWTNLGTITSIGWNNFTAAGLISSTYTIQLIGATEASDSIQDNWDIDCIYLHTWNSTGGPYGWTKFGTDTSHPWIWGFDFPNGMGYYEFYSIGMYDGDVEDAPAGADSICRYT